jgi:hypothetical protein
MSRNGSREQRLQYERVAATSSALVILGLAVFLLVRNEEISDPRLFFALRLLLSFGTAVLGATIPGLLTIGWSSSGIAIRAGGALALFALTFLYTPDLVQKVPQSTHTTLSAPGGVAAQEIKNSTVVVNPASPGSGTK